MKNTILIFILLFASISLFSQTEKTTLPISIGYYGPYLIQPGLKIGTSFNLKEWGVENSKKNEASTRSQSFFISPQIGLFTKPEDHTSFIINADIGYQAKKIYSAFSIGLGYLAEFEIISISLNLGTGEIDRKNRERRDYFVPTINYELSSAINSNIRWFSKFSYGRKISSKVENSAIFIIEIGIKLNLNKIKY